MRPPPAMRNDLDELHVIADRAPKTLLALADRIEATRDDMHLVYRETELDELWRWIDADIDDTRASRDAAALPELLALKAEVMAIHDLVGGVDADTSNAARRLRELAHAPAAA